MPSWETYSNRMKAHGSTPRETVLNREKRTIESKIKNSPSYHHVIVNGVTKDLTIIDSDNLNEKKIIAMPGEDIKHGAVIEWMGQHWLVVSKDYNTELNTKAIMKQCNYKLKWVNEDKNVIERWCIIEDGTKLKRENVLRNSLAYWKRYVKTTPLIAGNSLKLYQLQRNKKLYA